jgi:hypothetical protein
VNWDALAALAEVLGAIGVIVPLLFLATQVRQNTKGTRSQTFESYRTGAQAVNEYNANHAKELVNVRSKSKQELTAEEEQIGRGRAFQMFNLLEASYHYHQDGILSDEFFENRVNQFMTMLEFNPAFLRYWQELGESTCTPTFIILLNDDAKVKTHNMWFKPLDSLRSLHSDAASQRTPAMASPFYCCCPSTRCAA